MRFMPSRMAGREMAAKHRKCKICKTRLAVSEGITNGLDFVCGIEHLAELGLQRAQKEKQKQAKRKRRELRERKERVLTLQEWINRAQRKVNALVVLEDKGKGCISCDTGIVTDAGHFYHRGSKYRTSWLTLYRINLNGQCRHCNSYAGGGNQDAYRRGFIARYGAERFAALEELKRRADSKELPKPTIEEVKAFIAETDAKLKALREQEA